MPPETFQPSPLPLSTRVGIDIGGTFTDFVIYDPESGQIETFKLLSTPRDPAEAVLKGLDQIRSSLSPQAARLALQVIHGSTVATNALLERKGARTALVTTSGFGDVLQIGRQNRPSLYDFDANPPPPLVPPDLRYEVEERVDSHADVLVPLNQAGIPPLISDLQVRGVASVAICLLFSFLRPEHELELAGRLRAAGFFVSPSCEVLPEYREYERASTTAVNAYVSPVLDRYLAHLEVALPGEEGRRLRVMQSNGGNISLGEARRNGVRCILSGPAGGVVGARQVAELAYALTPSLAQGAAGASPFRSEREKNRVGSRVRVITFDMGGTSTDVALIDGAPQITSESVVGGCPIRIPILDIHTIGAGGGSIARVDAGGALRVGPESAGADPGPACYGRGALPAVTDANLVLGRLAAEHFLGGQMPLDAGRARSALARLGEQLGLDTLRAALGVVEVANAHMERALRVISVERGRDPREFTLLSFGGAGGLHAADLARRLGIPRLLVPPLASTLSAFGMLAADVVKDYIQTVMLPGDTPLAEIAAHLELLAERGRREVLAEGITESDIDLEPFLDIRYLGQSYELTVPFDEKVMEGFHVLHQQAYGYTRPAALLEIVNLRLRATGKVVPPPLQPLDAGQAGGTPTPVLLELRPAVISEDGGLSEIAFYRGEDLLPGSRFAGPAVVVRADTTILLGPTDHAHVDGYQNLWISIGK